MDDQIRSLIHLVPALRDGQTTVTPLKGGITNRNFRVDVGGDSYVLRVGGANTTLLGIDRACEYACSRAAAVAGVGAEVIAFLPDQGVLVTRLLHGRLLTAADFRESAVLRRMVQSLRRYHESPPGAGNFSPFTTVRNYHALAREHGVKLPPELDSAFEQLKQIERALHTNEPPCPCHNDLLSSNFLDDGTTVRIIDWEYAGMGDRFFDLGNLAVNNLFSDEQDRLLLELYFGEVRPEHVRRLRLMRLASDMREAMWGFLQAGVAALDFDYVAYGHRHLERFLAWSKIEHEW